jgi:uncharacterized Zn finger protein
MWWRDKKYVSQAERKALAAKESQKRGKRGGAMQPVRIEGRKIAKTVWGEAWCQHLETADGFASRVERGRTYVRNGSVIDLKIAKGAVDATVVGSEVYTQKIAVKALPAAAWAAVKSACAGRIASAVELLQGRVSKEVMTAVSDPKHGVMPRLTDLNLKCSCPDSAGSGSWVCKHLAAVLYGVGARLDAQPELLFALRGVDHLELVDAAATNVVAKTSKPGRKTVAATDFADVFGIDLGDAPPAPAAKAPKPPVKKHAANAAQPSARPAPKTASSQRATAVEPVKVGAPRPPKKSTASKRKPAASAKQPAAAKSKR